MMKPVLLFLLALLLTPGLSGCDESESPPASTARGDSWTRTVDGMVMLYVPAGVFKMGSTDTEIAGAHALCEE